MATQSMFTNPYDAQIAQQEAGRARALEVSKIPWYERGAYEGQMAGEDIGRGLGGMLGMQTPEDAKQAKIEEVMGQFGEGKKTPEQLMQIADSFRAAGMLDLWEEVMGMAKDAKPSSTTSNPYLDAKRERNERALLLQQQYGNMEGVEDKKAFKRQLIEAGVGDSTVFASISSEINTLTSAGIDEEKDIQKWQHKLAKQMSDNNIPSLETSVASMEANILENKGNLPGINYLEKYDPRSGAKDTYTAFSKLRNIVLKDRSGAAVTNPEFKRLQEEIRGATFITDDDVIRWTAGLREVLETDKGAIFAGYGSKVKDSYWKNKEAVRMYKAPNGGKKRTLSSFASPSGNIFHNDGVDWFDNNGDKVDISKVK